MTSSDSLMHEFLTKKQYLPSANIAADSLPLAVLHSIRKSFVMVKTVDSFMNHRLEMKAESTSSDLKDRVPAMYGQHTCTPKHKNVCTQAPVGTLVHALSRRHHNSAVQYITEHHSWQCLL
jgi:hypothetical protein